MWHYDGLAGVSAANTLTPWFNARAADNLSAEVEFAGPPAGDTVEVRASLQASEPLDADEGALVATLSAEREIVKIDPWVVWIRLKKTGVAQTVTRASVASSADTNES